MDFIIENIDWRVILLINEIFQTTILAQIYIGALYELFMKTVL